MMKTSGIISLIIMATSLLVLMLEAISNKNAKILSEKPHLRLLTTGAIVFSLLFLCYALLDSGQFSKKPTLYVNDVSSIFLIINTLTAVFIGKKTLKIQTGEIYFLILASLALSIVTVSSPSLLIKMVTSTSWLVLMTTLAIRSAQGGKKAEIGLKMLFFTIIVMVIFLLALLCLSYANLPINLNLLPLKTALADPMGFCGLGMIALLGLAFSGAPPFHFAHIDCANGSNTAVSFLFLSNSFIQGCALLFQIRFIFIKSELNMSHESSMLAFVLILGFIILWIRALDQSKILRMVSYVATSVGPLFSLSMLFGGSVLLPKMIFLLAMYSFVTLTLLTLYGSLAYMSPINFIWQTWEDLSGFGKLNPWQTLTFLVALASIAGLPGTLGYFVKLSLIAPLKDNLLFSGAIFLSIAIGAACTMRVFVFAFSKHASSREKPDAIRPHMSIVAASLILIVLGFFPFVR